MDDWLGEKQPAASTKSTETVATASPDGAAYLRDIVMPHFLQAYKHNANDHLHRTMGINDATSQER